jgi:hypothetical protein
MERQAFGMMKMSGVALVSHLSLPIMKEMTGCQSWGIDRLVINWGSCQLDHVSLELQGVLSSETETKYGVSETSKIQRGDPARED